MICVSVDSSRNMANMKIMLGQADSSDNKVYSTKSGQLMSEELTTSSDNGGMISEL